MKKTLLIIVLLLILFQVEVSSYEAVKTYLVTSSWKCPADVTSVKVECRGSGGGGGGVAADTNKAAGAGAGGQYVVSTTFAVTPGTTYTITIGNGGSAGASSGGNGGVGGVVWFKSNDANGVVARGGAGGQSYENGFQGGVGSVDSGVGDTVRAGGSGGAGGAWNGSGGGGEGGNSDKVGENGGNGSSEVAGTAGGAGAGGGDGGNGNVGKLNAAGAAGTVPGGGGSGGSVGANTTNRAGGAGGKGKIVLTYNTLIINIGNIPAVGNDYDNSGSTMIDLNSPASATGTITSIEIQAIEGWNMSNVEVGIFYLVSPGVYSTRSNVFIGDVYGYQVFTDGISLAVEEGDKIGVYWFYGRLDKTHGGSGSLYAAGDNIPCTEVSFASYEADDIIFLHGTGVTAPEGWSHKWNTLTIGKWNTTEFSKWNGIE